MGTLLKDLRYGLRMLARTPGFTAIAVLSLALGIGVNTTVFSLMDAVMLRSLPVRNPDQIVEVATGEPGGAPHTDFSYPLYAGLRDNNQSLSGLVAYSNTNFGLAAGDQTERIRGELVSANYFSVLGVQPSIGSAFAPSDEAPGAPRAAVISDALWTRLLSRDPSVLNKTILLLALAAHFQPALRHQAIRSVNAGERRIAAGNCSATRQLYPRAAGDKGRSIGGASL